MMFGQAACRLPWRAETRDQACLPKRCHDWRQMRSIGFIVKVFASHLSNKAGHQDFCA